ncbi:hypothetical protein ABPG74_010190 [Tetrahymena malaccensis]
MFSNPIDKQIKNQQLSNYLIKQFNSFKISINQINKSSRKSALNCTQTHKHTHTQHINKTFRIYDQKIINQSKQFCVNYLPSCPMQNKQDIQKQINKPFSIIQITQIQSLIIILNILSLLLTVLNKRFLNSYF